MKIKQAMVCLDCDEVSLITTHCPLCLSRSVVRLAVWLPPKDAATDIVGKAENLGQEIARMKRRMIEMCASLDNAEEPLGIGA